MRQTLLLSLYLLLSIFCYSQKSAHLLSKAYQVRSTTLLDSFFKHWVKDTKPLTTEAINELDESTKNVYQVFQAFYQPKDLNKIGGSEWGNNIYKKVKYLLIQDEVPYQIGDSFELDGGMGNVGDITTKNNTALVERVVQNFRPKLQFDSADAVVLTKQYDALLNYFLGETHVAFAVVNMMAPARSEGESRKRQDFLEKSIKIFYGHWGGYWQLYSYPVVQKIVFDNTFTNAIVHYQMVYQGGEAYLKKVNGEWILIKAKLTWIE